MTAAERIRKSQRRLELISMPVPGPRREFTTACQHLEGALDACSASVQRLTL